MFATLRDLLFRTLVGITVRALDLWVDLRGERVRTAAEDLALHIECKLGLRRGAVSIYMKHYPDGSVVPTVELYEDLTPQQFEVVEAAMEKLRGAPLNVRPPPRAYN